MTPNCSKSNHLQPIAPQPKNSRGNDLQINLTTRNRPKHNYFDQKLTKRSIAQNTRICKIVSTKQTTTIAIQTEELSNKSRGRLPLRTDPFNQFYTLSNAQDMPQYRKFFVSNVWG